MHKEVQFESHAYLMFLSPINRLYPEVQAKAKEILGSYGEVDHQLFVGNWSPDKFTSVCQTALERRQTEDGGKLYQLCNEVASAEWKLLFDSCIKVVNDP